MDTATRVGRRWSWCGCWSYLVFLASALHTASTKHLNLRFYRLPDLGMSKDTLDRPWSTVNIHKIFFLLLWLQSAVAPGHSLNQLNSHSMVWLSVLMVEVVKNLALTGIGHLLFVNSSYPQPLLRQYVTSLNAQTSVLSSSGLPSSSLLVWTGWVRRFAHRAGLHPIRCALSRSPCWSIVRSQSILPAEGDPMCLLCCRRKQWLRLLRPGPPLSPPPPT
jgi:hypothetical protein